MTSEKNVVRFLHEVCGSYIRVEARETQGCSKKNKRAAFTLPSLQGLTSYNEIMRTELKINLTNKRKI